MRFTEINLFGVYVAPISLIMVAAWLIMIGLRTVADDVASHFSNTGTTVRLYVTSWTNAPDLDSAWK